jgi:chromosome segregation protein
MQFNRLRLKGFKSFVDPTELVVERGMTGIVGPNGCGKSNLVEALRWVMGETSAKRMRGGEMDDVIFAGSQRRPAHNLAEVAVHLDNGDRTAPAQFNDLDELDIVRRIEREKGSTYRVNGRETRARDVQLLFADQATGAGSTALVSQGRIGTIINSKPSDRRTLLEEAAGISGLHSRRHEAELRLKAAESNLERLDDVIQTLEQQQQQLQKQVRQAKRYRNLSERIRRTEALLLHLDHQRAKQALAEARERLQAAETKVAELTEAASERATEQAEAQNALPDLRQAEAEASAELQRLNLAKQQLEQEERQVEQTRKQAQARLDQTDADKRRAEEQARDADNAVQRLEQERAELRQASEGEQEARAAAERERASAQETAQAREAELSELNQQVAADEAQARNLDKRIDELARRLDKLQRQRAETQQQIDKLTAEDGGDGRETERARQRVEQAEQALTDAQGEAEAADQALADAREQERAARETRQAAEAARDKLQAEIDALAGVVERGGDDSWTPVIDSIRARKGYEAALGAALGDDLDAPEDSDAPVHWLELPPLDDAPALPDGATALASVVRAPHSLGRRLSQVGVVKDRAEGARLQPKLSAGQRLVSTDGDLWRWDGFVAGAEAPTAAAQRLEQQNRLSELRGEMPDRQHALDQAQQAFDTAKQAAHDAAEREKAARQAVGTAQRELDTARKEQARLEKEAAATESRLASLREGLERQDAEIREVEEQLAQARQEKAELPDVQHARQQVNDLRTTLAEARSALSQKQSAVERLDREADQRARRLQAIEREVQSWQERAQAARQHLDDLEKRRAEARDELAQLAAKPEELRGKREALSESIEAAERTRQQAADALAQGERRQSEADRALKDAEKQLGEAREQRVRAESQVEQAQTNYDQIVERIEQRLHLHPERALEAAEMDPGAELPAREEAESQLQRLTRERDNIGPVNLRAEQEEAELQERIDGMRAERQDLTEAIQRLRSGIASLNKEGRERLLAAFEQVQGHFTDLFTRLFGGGEAQLSLTQTEDPLEAGLEIYASPPGKKLQVMSLLSGGEQALTALALLFAVFLVNPAPICVLDEVDAPLDDANVDRFCTLVEELSKSGKTRFLVITHHRMTMARMDRLFGVTMSERGVSQLVSVDLQAAEELRESA